MTALLFLDSQPGSGHHGPRRRIVIELRQAGLVIECAKGPRDGEGEYGTLARLTIQPDAAAVCLYDAPANCETQPGAGDAMALRGIGPLIRPKDTIPLMTRDTNAVVRHRDDDLCIDRFHDDVDRPTLGRILHGVFEEIVQHLTQPSAVAHDEELVRHGALDAMRRTGDPAYGLINHSCQVHQLQVKVQDTGF